MTKKMGPKPNKRAVKKSFTAPSSSQDSEQDRSKQIIESLLKCVQTGDLNLFRDVLASQIMASNKLRLAEKTGLGRQTLYDLIDPERNFNPALATVSAVIRGLKE